MAGKLLALWNCTFLGDMLVSWGGNLKIICFLKRGNHLNQTSIFLDFQTLVFWGIVQTAVDCGWKISCTSWKVLRVQVCPKIPGFPGFNPMTCMGIHQSYEKSGWVWILKEGKSAVNHAQPESYQVPDVHPVLWSKTHTQISHILRHPLPPVEEGIFGPPKNMSKHTFSRGIFDV